MDAATLQILRHEPDFVVINKPAGYHVHQPERPSPRVDRGIVCLQRLRDQLGQRVFPVHRLDVPTTGALLFALNSEAASSLSQSLAAGDVNKVYYAVVRGHPPLGEGEIDSPLRSDSSDAMVEARTRWRTIARGEIEGATVGKRSLPARFALVEARPETGRFHQIRRHFAKRAHPIVGDAAHGDSHCNRFARERLNARGLLLHARRLEFSNPRTGERVSVMAPFDEPWATVAAALGWEKQMEEV